MIKSIQNLAGSVTGNNVKAVLCIRKVRQPIDQENNDGIDALGDDPESVTNDVNQLNKKLLKKAEASLKGKAVATWNDISSMAGDHNYIAIEVQYNPSSLRLDTKAGEQKDFSVEKGRTNLSLYNAPSQTTLSLELLFDDTNNMDAFMVGDNPITGLTASNVAEYGKSAAKNLKGGFSVQRQMEGLLSLLAVPTARDVIFFWGDMSFHGQVTEVDEQYTMFNKKGHPVRGTVRLTIQQGDSLSGDNSVKKNEYDDRYWEQAFDETFSEQGTGGSMLDKANKFTNNTMLNLKL